jgi:hypothetical protein
MDILFICGPILQRREVLHQQAMDEDVAAADAPQEDTLDTRVEEAGVVPGDCAVPPPNRNQTSVIVASTTPARSPAAMPHPSRSNSTYWQRVALVSNQSGCNRSIKKIDCPCCCIPRPNHANHRIVWSRVEEDALRRANIRIYG